VLKWTTGVLAAAAYQAGRGAARLAAAPKDLLGAESAAAGWFLALVLVAGWGGPAALIALILCL